MPTIVGEHTSLTAGDTVCSYNGIDFGANCRTLSIDIKPVFDSAGRVVSYHDCTFTIWSIIAPPNVGTQSQTEDVNDIWPTVERALAMAAGELRYESKGLGTNFHINTPGGG